MKNTSVALGSHFDDFIKSQIAQGRYNNASEVIRAGLRLLEDNESQVLAMMARPIVRAFKRKGKVDYSEVSFASFPVTATVPLFPAES